LKLKFSEILEAKQCLEELKDFREGVTVKHFTKDDSESTSLVMIVTHTRLVALFGDYPGELVPER